MRVSIIPRVLFVGLLVVVMSSLRSPHVASAGKYTVTGFATLFGTEDGQFDFLDRTVAQGINSSGLVAAHSYMQSDNGSWFVAFTSQDGAAERLGPEDANSVVTDLNDVGDVVGYIAPRDDEYRRAKRPVLWKDGKLIELRTLGGDIGTAEAINSAGDIVGSTTIVPGDAASQTDHAALWRGDDVIDLGGDSEYDSQAYGINDNGDVVGSQFSAESLNNVPFVWNDDEMTFLELPDQLMGGDAISINDDSTIVGSARTEGGNQYPARWIDGEVELLPTLIDGGEARPLKINNAGQIVGYATLTDEGPAAGLTAVLWEGDSVIDLNSLMPESSDIKLTIAQDINDAGQIVAGGNAGGGGETRSFILNPVDQSAARVTTDSVRVPAATLRTWAS